MKNSRTLKSVLNIFSSVIFQVLSIIFNFILRTLFIKELGINILGINGLFSNILSVLSLAELGINMAMTYSLYKPLNEKNSEKISALLNYYKKIYIIISFVILILGLTVIPFMKYIVNVDINNKEVIEYYLLFLLNSVISYFAIYRVSVVIADQKEYKLKKIDMLFLIIKFIFQFIILKYFHNYYLYLISQILVTVLINCSKTMVSRNLYKINKKDKLDKKEKKKILTNVKSLFVYQIGNVILNNTDNILISIITGTLMVGYYSNYTLITTAIAGITSLFFTSMQSSIGNFNIKSSEKEKYNIYKALNVGADYIYGFCTIALLCLLNPFIKLWLGEKFILGFSTVTIICVNFYVTGLLFPNWCYRFTTNLFEKAKYTMIIASILNIFLSIILGKIWGINGILIATAISRILTSFWYEPKVLYKEYFKEKFIGYFIMHIKNVLYIVCITTITLFSISKINIKNNILNFICQCIIVAIIPNIMFYIKYRRNNEFKFIKNKLVVLKNKDF